MEPQTILVDIRRDSEVYNKRIDPRQFSGAGQYVIPMNMIRFNRETIVQHLKWVPSSTLFKTRWLSNRPQPPYSGGK